MRRSFLRQAFVVLATCALFLPIALDYGVPAQAASFTFSDPSCSSFSFDPNTSTLTCQQAGGGGAFSCGSIGASPSSSTSLPNNITLSVSCSGGTAPYIYSWTGGGSGGCPASGGSSSQQLLSAPGAAVSSCAYNVSVTDSATPAANANKGVNNITWTAGGGGGPGQPPTPQCNNVTGQTVYVPITYSADGGPYQTKNYGSFTPDGALIAYFTTSSAAASIAGQSGVIKGVEYQTPPTGRTGDLSTVPCDFAGTNAVKLNGIGCGKASFSSNMAPSEGLTQGTTLGKCQADLQPNTTYYFNLTNTGSYCGGSAVCDMILYFTNPGGT